MTLNKKKKGERKELLCKKELEKEGWTVVFKSCTVKRGPCFVGLDFADLFDVVAVKCEQIPTYNPINRKNISYWKFVSVKHYSSAQTKYPQHQEDIRKFRNNYLLFGMDFELWIWNAPAWRGRGKNKTWSVAHWEKIIIK